MAASPSSNDELVKEWLALLAARAQLLDADEDHDPPAPQVYRPGVLNHRIAFGFQSALIAPLFFSSNLPLSN